MALTSRIEAFKRYFDIDFINANIEFCLDTKINLVGKFEGKEYILTNQKSNHHFLSYKTMKSSKKYDIRFLRTIRIIKKYIFTKRNDDCSF